MTAFRLCFSRLVLCLGLVLGAHHAGAQSVDTPALYSEATLKAKLAQLEREPENFNLLWEVAAIAAQQGAYDEAITALERLLIYFPRDPKLRLELGVMYYRLGSYGQAKRQFELARSLGPNEAELRRLEQFEPAVERGARGLRFSNSVTVSVGHRSNLFTTASGPAILAFGVPFFVSPEQDGTFYSVTASSRLTWTLNNARADKISARVWATYSDFDGDLADFDRGSIGLELSYERPVFTNFEGYALDLRGAIRRDDTNLLGQPGTFDLWEVYVGGLRKTNFSRTTLGYSYTEAEQPFGTDLRTGLVTLGYAQRISPRWSAGGEVYAGHQSGNSQASRDLYGAEANATYRHRFLGGRLDARARISLAYDISDANGLTPFVSPIVPVDTDRVSASISEEITFAHGFDLRLNVTVVDQSSSVPNGEFDDVQWSISLRKRF